MNATRLQSVFQVITPTFGVEAVPVSAGVYQELDARFSGFRQHLLVSEFAFDGDWPTWEIHPAGDEILYLLEGAAELVLWRDGGEERIRFAEAGTTVVIPRGTWHTARTKTPCRILFITPGEGTLNRERPV